MKMIKKYYKEVCQRRMEDLKELYTGSHAISYRWQDIVEEAKKNRIKVLAN